MRLGGAIGLGLAGLVTLAGVARAEDAPPRVLPSVYRFAPPPPGFRPEAASDAERAVYGLPSRPGASAGKVAGLAAWTRAMTAARYYIAPMIRQTGRQHRPAMFPVMTSLSRTAGTMTTENWAGQVVENGSTAYGPSSFAEVLAQWEVSAAQQAVGVCAGTDVEATWVGVDGLSISQDVMQAGTEADAECSGGYTVQDEYAWFEWYPADEYQVANFPVVPGGSMFVVLQATSATTATVTFVNLQTNAYTVVGFSAPAGTTLIGNTAEWIVERPSMGRNMSLGTLSDIGEIPMQSEVGFLVDQINTNNFIGPGAPAAGLTDLTLTMLNSAYQTIASATPEGTSAQVVQAVGPAEIGN